jgi:hypothetical protein
MIKMLPATVATTLLAVAIVSSAHAAAAPPSFVGTPKAAFAKSTNDGKRFYTLAVVVRFNKALPSDAARVVIAARLRNGQKVGNVFGGDTPHRIGTTSRHCYTIEVGRPRPVSTPKAGARWTVGVMRGGIIKHTASTTLRVFPTGEVFGPAEARQLGC